MNSQLTASQLLSTFIRVPSRINSIWFVDVFGDSMGPHLERKYEDRDRDFIQWACYLDTVNMEKLAAFTKHKAEKEVSICTTT